MNSIYIGNGKVLVRPVYGGKLVVSAEDLSLGPDLILNGVMEVGLTNYLVQHLAPGMIVVDVGAHIGYFSVLMGYLTGPQGRVLAYEANPYLIPFLEDNLSLNYLRDHCSVTAKAIYSTNGKTNFYCAKRFSGNSSTNRHNEYYFKHYRDEIEDLEVECGRLDSIFSGLDHINLVKIDVEGGEYHALLGSLEIYDHIDRFILEFNRNMMGNDWPKFSKLLKKLHRVKGAEFYTLSPQGQPEPANLEELLTIGSNPHVLMETGK